MAGTNAGYAILAAVAVFVAAACGHAEVEFAEVVSGSRTVDSAVIELFVTVCGAEPSTQVAESADEVVVTVTYEPKDDDLDCGRIVELRLDDPLGDRTVIDGHTGSLVPVGPVTEVVG